MTQCIAYTRVSTREQKRSGLGLAAQRQAIADYARNADTKSPKRSKTCRPAKERTLKNCAPVYAQRLRNRRPSKHHSS